MRLIVCFLLLAPALIQAHPVSLSWAKARISNGQVTVNFKILAEDLFYFHELKPDDDYNFDVDELKAAASRHAELIEQYFFITDSEGQQLKAELVDVNNRSLDEEKINAMDLMKYDIFYKVTYPLPVEDWQQLTFHQEFVNHGIGIPSLTFLTVYNNTEQLVSNVEVSPGNPYLLKPEKSPEPKNPSKLTSSYFTIKQNGVRHELTIPLDVFYDLSYQGQQDSSLLDRASVYFSAFNPVHINGERSMASIRHMQTIQAHEDSEKAGFVYIDLFYPSASVTNKATITWGDFNWKFRWFNSEIMAIDSSYQHTFSRYQKDFVWKEKVGVGTVKSK